MASPTPPTERRVINRPKTPAGIENITTKVKSVDDRVKDIETYLQKIDPILRTEITDIAAIKTTIAALNEELTKIAGVQARTNSYLDGKLAEINATFGAIVSVVKKIDDDYQALFTEDSGSEQEGQEGQLTDDGQPIEDGLDETFIPDEIVEEEQEVSVYESEGTEGQPTMPDLQPDNEDLFEEPESIKVVPEVKKEPEVIKVVPTEILPPLPKSAQKQTQKAPEKKTPDKKKK